MKYLDRIDAYVNGEPDSQPPSRAAVSALVAAARALEPALEHVQELRDAWARGCISEHDGHGGMRSNRNVDVEVSLRAALAAIRGLGE